MGTSGQGHHWHPSCPPRPRHRRKPPGPGQRALCHWSRRWRCWANTVAFGETLCPPPSRPQALQKGPIDREAPGPPGRDGDTGLARHGDSTGTAWGCGVLARQRDGGHGRGGGTGGMGWGQWHSKGGGHGMGMLAWHRDRGQGMGQRDGDTGHGKGTGMPVWARHRDRAHGTDGDTECWQSTGGQRVLARHRDGISGCWHGKGWGLGTCKRVRDTG